jgi:predicted GIY-YIG superfamily endonuclease
MSLQSQQLKPLSTTQLFCENPVEGLDSETSLHIMEFLKGYSSNSSRRVIITLNRPSNFIWNLIDNVILLSRGRVVYEGTRFDMEAFFAHHQRPTPKRFSPIEHYLAVVNGFRQPSLALNWEANFKKWQEESEEGDGDDLGDDIETCFPSNIPDVIIPQKPNATANTKSKCSKLSNFACGIKYQLVHRYMLQMFLNPGILQIRLVMYTMLSLFLGALFFNLEKETEDIQSIDSHAGKSFWLKQGYCLWYCFQILKLASDSPTVLQQLILYLHGMRNFTLFGNRSQNQRQRGLEWFLPPNHTPLGGRFEHNSRMFDTVFGH